MKPVLFAMLLGLCLWALPQHATASDFNLLADGPVVSFMLIDEALPIAAMESSATLTLTSTREAIPDLLAPEVTTEARPAEEELDCSFADAAPDAAYESASDPDILLLCDLRGSCSGGSCGLGDAAAHGGGEGFRPLLHTGQRAKRVGGWLLHRQDRPHVRFLRRRC